MMMNDVFFVGWIGMVVSLTLTTLYWKDSYNRNTYLIVFIISLIIYFMGRLIS